MRKALMIASLTAFAATAAIAAPRDVTGENKVPVPPTEEIANADDESVAVTPAPTQTVEEKSFGGSSKKSLKEKRCGDCNKGKRGKH